MSAYTVRAVRWDRGWELYIDDEAGQEVGVTQSTSLRAAEDAVRSYLRMDLGENEASKADVEIAPDLGELSHEVDAAREATATAERAQREAAARQRSVALKVRKLGLSGAETARVLKVSPQRVSQLLAGIPEQAEQPLPGPRSTSR